MAMTGAELKARREQYGWSQRALAVKLGITRNYVSMLESGRRAITLALAARIEVIFDDEEISVHRGQFLRLGGIAAATAVAGSRPDENGNRPEEVTARRIFAAITACNTRPFATTQTSHATDLVIRRHVAAHRPAVKVLGRWMATGSPVLRVNAAGVLAKLGPISLVDSVIGTLQENAAIRHLYLTAVVHRVCRLPWGKAEYVARRRAPLPELFREALTAELGNPRDGAARWCALQLLGHEAPRTAILERLQDEQSTETLRALGQALA